MITPENFYREFTQLLQEHNRLKDGRTYMELYKKGNLPEFTNLINKEIIPSIINAMI